jgi:hypothetical protein
LGFADPAFRFSMNFIGAPALTAAEFKDYRQNLILGASLRVTAPLGQYDSAYSRKAGTSMREIPNQPCAISAPPKGSSICPVSASRGAPLRTHRECRGPSLLL